MIKGRQDCVAKLDHIYDHFAMYLYLCLAELKKINYETKRTSANLSPISRNFFIQIDHNYCIALQIYLFYLNKMMFFKF